jgi:peptidoglycan/xylan/chitin deacetylase (PgdA/CDA1 family)
LSDSAVEDEVVGSMDEIQRETGRRANTFAYPYGYWSATAASIVARVCSHACTTELRLLSAGEPRHLLPRLDMFYLRGWGRLESFGSISFRAYVGARAQVRLVGQWVRPRVHA